MANPAGPSFSILVPVLLLGCFCAESYSTLSLRLRGGYDNGYDGGGYEGGGGYDRGYGDDGGGYRGGSRGGYRGGSRGRGRGRRGPPEGPVEELKLYVGGLAWEIDDQALQEAFAAFGECEAKVMVDRYSGRSRGFGFVTFTDVEACNTARDAMNGKELQGRTVAVNNARQRTYDTAGGAGGEGGAEGGQAEGGGGEGYGGEAGMEGGEGEM